MESEGSRTSHRVVLALVLAFVLAAGGAAALRSRDTHEQAAGGIVRARHDFDTSDPVARACELEKTQLARIWRGYDPVRSEDITMVPREPNFIGSWDLTSHSGPWDYIQDIPLILYGPGFIADLGVTDSPARITDVYPTIGELVGVDLEPRAGRVLEEALAAGREGRPRVVLVIVWDGAGGTTLRRWPESWPTLRRLEQDGTSFANAWVDTSPSITPSVHASLGTGAFPRAHRVTANWLRTPAGGLVQSFAGSNPDDLELSTFADQIDAAFSNRSRVGLLAWKPWHLGMLGHGAAAPGGDRDEVALLHYRNGPRLLSTPAIYSTPTGVEKASDLGRHIDRVDARDGRRDGRWREHSITLEDEARWDTYSNPAWAAYQADVAQEMLRRGNYGQDEIPDLLLMNFKMTDLAAHRWGTASAETAEVLRGQDEALEKILAYLDQAVGDYVVVVTADHGASPLARQTGAWPVSQEELLTDIDRHFDVPSGSDLVEATGAYGLYLDYDAIERFDIDDEEVARYINDYTIAQNSPNDELPEGYRHRGGEQVFSAAWASDDLELILKCAFGSSRPMRADD
jgi:predicted AlkP superfamily pyrophosphatase or phosphodiesterase